MTNCTKVLICFCAICILKRGYSIAKIDKKVISSAKDVKTGDKLDIEFDDGTINTKVI